MSEPILPAQKQIQPFPRVATGVRGLDQIMMGGFLRGGIYLIMGPPGSGKTILSNQIGFNHVSRGGRALYVSLLSEGHGRLFGHLKPLKFFDENAISDSFNFISAYQTLEKDGLDGLLRSLAHMVRQYKADLLFLDGVASAEELAKSPVSFKKFVHDLNTVLSTSGVTAVLLSSFVDHVGHPEHTMVDGIISLTEHDDGMRSVKQLEVKKLRGSGHLRGRHIFTITETGISVFPRIETLWERRKQREPEDYRLLSTGVKKLDELLSGGIYTGSVTSLLGAAGTGKTTIGCQFLVNGAEKGEPGLYFGFYETPRRMARKLERVSIGLQKQIDAGRVHLIWQPPLEHTIDELAGLLLDSVREHKIKRLFLDGVGGLEEGMIERKRLFKAFAALANELRDLGVTTYFTEETELFPLEVETPVSDHSAITDNIIYLRHVDLDSELVRFISVLKSRETESSGCIHRFELTPKGIKIGEQFQGVEALFTGTPRQTGKPRSAPKTKTAGRHKR